MTHDQSYTDYAQYLLEQRELPFAAVAGRIERVTPSSYSKKDIFAIVNQAQNTDLTNTSPDSETELEQQSESDDTDTKQDDTSSSTISHAVDPEDEPGESSWSA